MADRTGTRPESTRRRGFVDAFVQDIRLALRSFRSRPAFTAAAVLTLGLAVAASTSVLSVADATLFRPLPFPDPERVVDVGQYDPGHPDFGTFGYPRRCSEALRSSPVFTAVAEYASWISQRFTVAGADGAQVVNGVSVSADFFRVFRVRPAVGRVFTADEEDSERPAVAILTSAGARRLFGAGRDVIGKTLRFVEGPVTVIGVMDDRFWYPLSPAAEMALGEATPDLLVPFALRSPSVRPDSFHAVAARLGPGATVEAAQLEADRTARRLGEPEDDGSRYAVRVQPLQRALVSEARPTLLTLLGVVGCLLLICCVNIANLLFSRSRARARELALRTALGAGRTRLFRQLLTEHLVLAAMSGALALAVTSATLGAFVRLLPAGLLLLPRLEIDFRLLGIALLATMTTGLLAGVGPALLASRADLAGALKSGGQPLTRAPRWRSAASGLLIVEAAALLVLLSGGSLLVNTLVRLKTIDLGFDANRLWTAKLSVPKTLYAETAAVGSLAGRMADTLRRLPGVESVGESDWGLLGGFCPGGRLTVEGRPEVLQSEIRHVSAPYFATVNMELMNGRLWTAAEENVRPQVAVINAAAARRYWPNQDPIGRRIIVNKEWPVRVVGVVGDLREADEREAPGPSVYLPLNPFSTRFYRTRTLVVRTSQPQTAAGRSAVRALAGVDPRLPVTVSRADQTLSVRRQNPRFYAVFVGLAAVFGLLLAAVGIAGVAAENVTRRTREIGIRLALGAEVNGVVRLVVRQVCVPVAVGVAAGLAAALAVSRVLASFLYEVTPEDPLTHLVAVLLLAGVALLAALLPARRAAAINPVEALRAE